MPSVITQLRDIAPLRALTAGEALRITELQAMKLLKLSGVDAPPVPDSVITDLPRIQVEQLYSFPASGLSQWAKGRWIIALNAGEPNVRKRFTLCHEFAHVLAAPYADFAYAAPAGMGAKQWAEIVADHFAACLLMPRAWVKKAWGNRIQDVNQLAQLFEVSTAAMRIRLASLGLAQPSIRCATLKED